VSVIRILTPTIYSTQPLLSSFVPLFDPGVEISGNPSLGILTLCQNCCYRILIASKASSKNYEEKSQLLLFLIENCIGITLSHIAFYMNGQPNTSIKGHVKGGVGAEFEGLLIRLNKSMTEIPSITKEQQHYFKTSLTYLS